MTTPVRDHLVDALYADLVGPFEGAHAHDTSRELIRNPSDWYLTGFLVPDEERDAGEDTLNAEEATGEPAEDDAEDGVATTMPKLFPASMGLSVLLPKSAKKIRARVSFAMYEPERVKEPGKGGQGKKFWRRVPHTPEVIELDLTKDAIEAGKELTNLKKVWVKGQLAVLQNEAPGLEAGTKALSLFVVNQQDVHEDEHRRAGRTLFQVQFELHTDDYIVPRPNRSGVATQSDNDARVLDLQFRERFEYVVGHNVAAEPVDTGGDVKAVRSRWIPRSEVRLVKARAEDNVEVRMFELAKLDSPEAIDTALADLPRAYEEWLKGLTAERLSKDHEEVRDVLLDDAAGASKRIRAGIELLKTNEEVRKAFCIANEAMGMAAQKRFSKGDPEVEKTIVPGWRLFQLAFVLLNLNGIDDPTHTDRALVELIFFPTGGGKTEAYLGVIAFTLALRRMRGQIEPHRGRGVAVLLRYTLRLLTLDQLSRATTLICALDILRERQPELLGEDAFTIGLWVGQSATPNRFSNFAERLRDAKQNRGGVPCPLENCPWCLAELSAPNLTLRPSAKKPDRVEVRCGNAGKCHFANPHPTGLPLVFVDEQVYTDLPSFLIATVDKFAMMPWRGETAKLFGKVTCEKGGRFYGAVDKAPKGTKALHDGLLPPDVIVQDELHLITGPLGTMVGLYEVALQLLSTTEKGDTSFRPKLIASTATANHAHEQIAALYGPERETRVFPPPAVDALETFFSEINTDDPGRLYIGVAAPGHPLKRILLRTYVSLLTAAKKLSRNEKLPAKQRDAAMTLVGYFNSLRELGGMRRLVEDDIRTQAEQRAKRVPIDGLGTNPWFDNRAVREPLELTSRRTTSQISEAKAMLAAPHGEAASDVVLASNMISVGIDIDRLGLMVVAGQPKTTSEYIQATSRVGRDKEMPGLVVTCYHMVRPRDRSHYEHFVAYHESFYRYVEAQSVTPFAVRALERGLTGAFIAAARLGNEALTPSLVAREPQKHLDALNKTREDFVKRSGEARDTVDKWLRRRIDGWREMASVASKDTIKLAYSGFDNESGDRALLHTVLKPPPEDLIEGEDKFTAPTSMRDVEPGVHLWLAQPGTKRGRSK